MRCGTLTYHLLFLLLLSALVAVPAAAQDETGNSCIDCHTDLDGKLAAPAMTMTEDVHYRRGLFCQDCHGGNPERGFAEGDPELAHSRRYDWRGAPKAIDIPEFCTRCHANVNYMKQYNPSLRVDQLLEYRSSRHGELLAEGDENVAQCVSCHGVHGILSVSDSRSPVHRANIPATCGACHADKALMKPYSLPTDQLAKYSSSVHGVLLLERGDAAAPACNDCHGNHGATPPGLNSIANACGECHALNRDLFNKSPHKKAFAEMELGECTTCHGHHDVTKTGDFMIGTGDKSICIDCHEDGEAGFEAAGAMKAQLDSLKNILASAEELLERAEQGGVDVESGRFDLQQARNVLIKARGAIHSFDPESFTKVTETGITEAGIVMEIGEAALHDLWLRQVGLAITIPLILLVALALYWKIRRIESPKH